MMATKAAALPSVTATGNASADRLSAVPSLRTGASAGSRTSVKTMAMSSTISQPTAMRPRSVSSKRRSCIAQEHDRARHRQGKTEHKARAHGPAEPPCQSHAEQRGARDLPDGAGDRDASNRQQVLEREMEADTEHQEDHADLGQLVRQSLIGDVSGRER